VLLKFGVRPHSIPDWLALVGDAADGLPGIPAWGAKSASAVLARFDHFESIPDDPSRLGIPLGRASRLVKSLEAHREEAFLYRRLATLRDDVPLEEELADLEWQGAAAELQEVCRELGDEVLAKRILERRDA
jgi:5'-3' exonuclease